MSNKQKQVVIAISKGIASLIEIPENMIVKIRDYDVDGVDEEVLQLDDDGDYYQEIILDEYNVLEENENKYTNYYKCVCGEEWDDNWSCMCNDKCSDCDKEIQPYQSYNNEKEEMIEHFDPDENE